MYNADFSHNSDKLGGQKTTDSEGLLAAQCRYGILCDRTLTESGSCMYLENDESITTTVSMFKTYQMAEI